MNSRGSISRKRHSGIQGNMLKKVLKNMPNIKENFSEQSLNVNSIFTNYLKKMLGM